MTAAPPPSPGESAPGAAPSAGSASAPVPALEASGIVKAFPGVLANDHVDFELRTGEIHALLGENGAGKSTLMNILAGLYRPDAGEILLDGTPVAFRSPRERQPRPARRDRSRSRKGGVGSAGGKPADPHPVTGRAQAVRR